MSAEKGSSKADTLVKVVLVFFISLLSFSVGTFVGKQVSDSDHRRMALEGEYKGDRQVASNEPKADNDSSEKISDKEVESLTEEFVNKEKNTPEASDESGKKPNEKVAEKTASKIEAATEKMDEKPDSAGYKTYKREAGKEAKDVKDVADKVVVGAPPTNGAVEERKPSSAALPSVAGSAIGKYTVQVGAYLDESEAKTRAADLKGKGWNSFVFSGAVEGRTWFRVSVGLFNNAKSANEFRAQFMKDANTKSAMVRKIIE